MFGEADLPALFLERNPVMRWMNFIVFTALVLVATTAWSTTNFPNMKCGPTTMPVTTCECPVVGDNHYYCLGALPKNIPPTMYGQVDCMGNPGHYCHRYDVANTVRLSCGPVFYVPCGNCAVMGPPLNCTPVWVPSEAWCTNTWGECVWEGWEDGLIDIYGESP